MSRRTDARTSTVVMLHGTTCHRPAERRRPVVLRFARQPGRGV